ncbi:hypothetical protein CONPUDRAFT_147364 [Coniophora puteana RWD-64-598 SS2]|uniref:Uncharacterized protein n=1 Tax=Coniophora puteana (strain RWD-64-598) TaxID=741705 RepID=A0A5M3M8J6_CONPW|nr:uncharacterized protein CONPUDRAFT_147364 [Coniophora puteana RWD-64-598 SS2]EIW75256.1 hypothetical protein CONPUDRAFT_147364 [Coniophora puteana RWD-64-598 SS2]
MHPTAMRLVDAKVFGMLCRAHRMCRFMFLGLTKPLSITYSSMCRTLSPKTGNGANVAFLSS